MGATISDVARAARVSPSTVSRALTSPSMVNERTRARVLEVAARLGYRPNLAARGLITGKTGNIGVIVPDLSNPFFAKIVQSAEGRARASGYLVFLGDTKEDPLEEIELIRALAKQVDGIVVCSSRMTERQIREVAPNPLVFLNEPFPGFPSVLVEPVTGLEEALRHLADLGHTGVVYLGGPRRSWSNQRRLQRLKPLGRRMGLEIRVLGPYVPHFAGGAEAAETVLESGTTAVLAWNDLVALGLINALGTAGVRVPDDISVIGWDDLEIAAMFTPRLTTVAQPLVAAGSALVDLLMNQLSAPDGQGAERVILKSRLVVRDSTGSPHER